MKMKIEEENGEKVVELDEEFFETFKYQENDYNVNNSLDDFVAYKSGKLVRDFEVDGLLTIGFP